LSRRARLRYGRPAVITNLEPARFDHPPEQLFDMLADIRNELKWQPDVRSTEKLTEGPVGPGTRFRGTYKGLGDLGVEITEYDRPNRLGFACRGSRMDMDVTFTFSPAGAGSEIGGAIDTRLKGFSKLMTPLLPSMMKREMAKRPAQMQAGLDTLYGPRGGAVAGSASGDA
jgi:uncharacterized protein YndB with AHSA1/START domain